MGFVVLMWIGANTLWILFWVIAVGLAYWAYKDFVAPFLPFSRRRPRR
jgi:hypothetical protein